MFALWLGGLNCTGQGWRVIIVPSLTAQWRGGLCAPWRCPLTVGAPPWGALPVTAVVHLHLEMCPEGSGSFGSGSCLENLQVFGTWILKWKWKKAHKIDFIEWNRWLFLGPASRAAVEADWSLSSNELNYNKYQAKSVVLALTVFDQILQKFEYLMAWMPVFLYSQNTQGPELESLPEGTKTKLKSCFKNEIFLAFSPLFSGL